MNNIELTDDQKKVLIDLCIDISKNDNEDDIKTNVNIRYFSCLNVLNRKVAGGVGIPSEFNIITRIEYCIDNIPLKDEKFTIFLTDIDYKSLCDLFGVENITKYKGYNIELK